ncbi:MAG: hypothetical protein ACREUG_03880 [Steroidobacteraceae bacterium]
MKCAVVELPGGARAIVCGGSRVHRCRCGRLATKQCDWKMRKLPSGRLATCDAWLCDECTHSAAEGKDLCPKHRTEWERHPANPQQEMPL